MTFRLTSPRKAVTLTELLVVLAIISLLATIAVPVYIQKTEQARIATARQETREIAMAEEQVGAIYGFYVPIHLLDNLANLPSGQGGTGGARDDFANYPSLASIAVMDPLGNINNQLSSGSPLYLTSANISNNVRMGRLVNSWTGPFLNAQRLDVGRRDRASLYSGSGSATQQEVSNALVLDPWGRPYRLYAPLGITGKAANTVGTGPEAPISSSGQFDPLNDNGVMSLNDPRFDRWAIVSYGRDGVTDTGKVGSSGQEIRDDIFYVFGMTAGESFYKAF